MHFLFLHLPRPVLFQVPLSRNEVVVLDARSVSYQSVFSLDAPAIALRDKRRRRWRCHKGAHIRDVRMEGARGFEDKSRKNAVREHPYHTSADFF